MSTQPTPRTTDPQVGALAFHRTRDLDARPVAEVSADGSKIRLQIGTIVSQWIAADHYLYSHKENQS